LRVRWLAFRRLKRSGGADLIRTASSSHSFHSLNSVSEFGHILCDSLSGCRLQHCDVFKMATVEATDADNLPEHS
jgi:hypothetical protein